MGWAGSIYQCLHVSCSALPADLSHLSCTRTAGPGGMDGGGANERPFRSVSVVACVMRRGSALGIVVAVFCKSYVIVNKTEM